MTAGLTAGQIASIVISTLVFIGLIVLIITLCICCLSPTCPCYYRRSHTTCTVVVSRQQAAPQVITATTTSTNTNTTNYPGPPPGPGPAPGYYPDTGYQPYPAAPTAKY